MELQIDPNLYTGDNDKYGVPRVTEILSAMLHEDYLMKWSNSMGLYKRKKYEEILDRSAYIGSCVHGAIERYVSCEEEFSAERYGLNIRNEISNAFNSFLEWWRIIESNNYRVLMQEETLICKYFGGTLDMLIEINGRTYIVDFKTSNYPSYKHFLQLSAYRYMLEEKGIKVDGCIILMLDKKAIKFKEFVLDFSNNGHLAFINQCEECFLSLVYGFYNRGIVEEEYKRIFGGKQSYGRYRGESIDTQVSSDEVKPPIKKSGKKLFEKIEKGKIA